MSLNRLIGQLSASSVVICVFILSSCPVVRSAPTVTSTLTEVRTVTQTNIVSSNYACAKLVNVTGACRRRRGFPIDEPVILTFDDDMDDSIDQAFHQTLHPQFVPTKTLGVEVTPVVLLPHPAVIPAVDSYSGYGRSNISPNREVIESSQSPSRKKSKNKDQPTPRIYFSELYGLLRIVLAQLQGSTSTVSVTVTNVYTELATSRIGTTATFFIMGCTPNPLPYPTCTAGTGKKRR